MGQTIIYVETKKEDSKKMLSYSAEEIGDLVDDLNMSMTGIEAEDIRPFLNAIALLTEIKKLAKTSN